MNHIWFTALLLRRGVMATKFRGNNLGSEFGSLPDNVNEVIERWKQLPVVLQSSGRYPGRGTKAAAVGMKTNLAMVEQCISVMGSLVTLLLAARIGLKLFTCRPGTPSCRLIVDLTDLLLWPFSGMTETVSSPNIVLLELSSLTAVILYPFTAWCLIRFMQHVSPLYIR